MAFTLGMTVHLCMAQMLMLVLMTLTLMQGDYWVSKGKNSVFNYLDSATSIKLATTVGHFVRDLDFENVLYGLITLFSFVFSVWGAEGSAPVLGGPTDQTPACSLPRPRQVWASRVALQRHTRRQVHDPACADHGPR